MTTTAEDREKEMRFLLAQIAANPERDWTEAKARIQVFREMGVGAAKPPA
jgi:hypothetical protein